jgi:hypothetical protein
MYPFETVRPNTNSLTIPREEIGNSRPGLRETLYRHLTPSHVEKSMAAA